MMNSFVLDAHFDAHTHSLSLSILLSGTLLLYPSVQFVKIVFMELMGGGRTSVGLKLWKHSIRIRIWSVLAVVYNEVQRLTLFIGHISRTTTPPNKNVYISA